MKSSAVTTFLSTDNLSTLATIYACTYITCHCDAAMFVVRPINLNTSIVSGTGDGSGLRRERNGKLHASRGKNGKRTTDGTQRYRRHLRQNTVGQRNGSLSGDSRHRYRQRYVQLRLISLCRVTFYTLASYLEIYFTLLHRNIHISSMYFHVLHRRTCSSSPIFLPIRMMID